LTHAAALTSILVSSNSGASSVACGSGDKLGREVEGFKRTRGTVGDDDEIERFDFSIRVCVLGSLELVDICQWSLRIFLTLVPVGVLPTYEFRQCQTTQASCVRCLCLLFCATNVCISCHCLPIENEAGNQHFSNRVRL
jgi:hypothetical protein